MKRLLLLLVALSGCGMSRLETAHAVQAESDTYVAHIEAIKVDCPTVSVCNRQLDEEAARYRAARAAICRAGKGCQ